MHFLACSRASISSSVMDALYHGSVFADIGGFCRLLAARISLRSVIARGAIHWGLNHSALIVLIGAAGTLKSGTQNPGNRPSRADIVRVFFTLH